MKKNLNLVHGANYMIVLTDGLTELPCSPVIGGNPIVSLPNFAIVTFLGEKEEILTNRKLYEFSTPTAKDSERFLVGEHFVKKYFNKVYTKNRF